jgi:hypothetical protein
MARDFVASAAAETQHSHDAHVSHHHGTGADEPAPVAPCPHCPLESGAANAGHASCVTVDAQQDGSAAPAKAQSMSAPAVLLANWLLPAARASPPLIGPPLGHVAPLPNAVTLNIRHCVLLI